MATSSFFRHIEIKTSKQARKLVEALEQAERDRGKKTVLRYSVREHIKDLFAKIKW